MPSTVKTLDLSPLPATARREIKDFYEFLLARRKHAKKKPVLRTLPATFATPIKVKDYLKLSRDELYDEI